jgi:hypothetical protein
MCDRGRQVDRTELIEQLIAMREKAEPVGWPSLIEYEMLVEIIMQLEHADE